MPELPEVETIRRQLKKYYLGERITEVTVYTPVLLQNITSRQLQENVRGTTIRDIRRRGKLLIFVLDTHWLVFHLGMSGIFLRHAAQSRQPRHIHLMFDLTSEKRLFYQDVRKFGKIWFYSHPVPFHHLGIEPLSKDFTLNNLKKLLHLKRMNIKRFLMEQSIIAGIGNIYANEILFRARISPERMTRSLAEEEVRRLYKAVPLVLRRAVDRLGTTYRAYRTVEGESGENQNFLNVYQQDGKPCRRCGTRIQKIVIGNRSTFYCPLCQR